MKLGLEREFLLEGSRSLEVLGLGLPGVTGEFFDYMIELVTGVHDSSSGAVAELDSIASALTACGVQFHPFASWGIEEPRDMASFDRVTRTSEYYRWVYSVACQNPFDLHHVGIHINLSDDALDEDQMVHAANWLRVLGYLFTLVAANSPLRKGRPSGYLSRRSFFFPNRYDVPLWDNAAAFREWIRSEEAARRIYPGKARSWMTACPRLRDNDVTKPIERVEFRAIDSGNDLPLSVIEGCCELAIRVVRHAADSGAQFPVSACDIMHNDKSVARCGRHALVKFNGHLVPVLDIARDWCSGIPALEDVLYNGSPAERILDRLTE